MGLGPSWEQSLCFESARNFRIFLKRPWITLLAWQGRVILEWRLEGKWLLVIVYITNKQIIGVFTVLSTCSQLCPNYFLNFAKLKILLRHSWEFWKSIYGALRSSTFLFSSLHRVTSYMSDGFVLIRPCLSEHNVIANMSELSAQRWSQKKTKHEGKIAERREGAWQDRKVEN